MSTTNIENIPAIMTIKQAAEAMQVHHTTVRTAIKNGLLPASQPDGRAYRITRSQLQQWIENTSTGRKLVSKKKSKKKETTCFAVVSSHSSVPGYFAVLSIHRTLTGACRRIGEHYGVDGVFAVRAPASKTWAGGLLPEEAAEALDQDDVSDAYLELDRKRSKNRSAEET